MMQPTRQTELFNYSIKTLILYLVIFFISSPHSAEKLNAQQVDVIYQLKASYIYNILHFIDFPETLRRKDKSLIICILGEDRFKHALDEIDNSQVAQQYLKVIRLGAFEASLDLQNCGLLYIVDSEKNNTHLILQQLDTTRVFTIGENNRFIEQGGLIQLYVEGDRLQFKINLPLVQKTLFKLSAQLIQLGVE